MGGGGGRRSSQANRVIETEDMRVVTTKEKLAANREQTEVKKDKKSTTRDKSL